MRFTKVQKSWYATLDGVYAVMHDSLPRSKSVWAEGDYEGFEGGEWSAVYDPEGRLRTDVGAGESIDWFPTMRDAMQHCRWHRRRIVRRR